MKAEDHLLPQAGTVYATDQHDAAGEECRRAQALLSTAPVQHEVVAGEAGTRGQMQDPTMPNM